MSSYFSSIFIISPDLKFVLFNLLTVCFQIFLRGGYGGSFWVEHSKNLSLIEGKEAKTLESVSLTKWDIFKEEVNIVGFVHTSLVE